MRAGLFLLAALALPGAAAALPGAAGGGLPGPSLPPADERLDVLRDVGIDQRLGESLPLDLAFRDESGRDVRLGDYFGERPVIVSLVYYECPMLCTVVLNGLTKALRAMSLDAGRDFEIVTVSIDPRETPALAAEKKEGYVERYGREGAAGGWHFLTGEAEAIERLAEAIGFRYRYDPAIDQYAHGAGIVATTPEGRLARYFYGVEFSARDLRLGLVEASANRIGTVADQILLLCYHYDPETGRYGRVALLSVRVGGALTLLGLGGFLFTMWRRELRERERG
jgi:protein SCO1/2